MSLLLIDPRAPMSYTSAQSGDNYRNWWPHPTMTAFTNDSIDRMEALARDTDNTFNMRRGGYALATRRDGIDDLLATLQPGVNADVFSGRGNIGKRFPAMSPDIRHVIHLQRGGDLSGQQMGTVMLDRVREAGGELLRGEVMAIDGSAPFTLTVASSGAMQTVQADIVVNAAGPFVGRIAAMFGVSLPIRNVYQQKLAFDDARAAVPRDMPFSIDLDPKRLGWTTDELAWLRDDAERAWLAGEVPGGTHCRPEGGERGRWVKVGWAYNRAESQPQADLANEPAADPHFPEIVLRAAAALLPSLGHYVAQPPRRFSHYGGYYTMTEENWPLIGPAGPAGSFVVGALSGFGSMAACAAGQLCAAWIRGERLPDYARDLSLARYDNAGLVNELLTADKGVL